MKLCFFLAFILSETKMAQYIIVSVLLILIYVTCLVRDLLKYRDDMLNIVGLLLQLDH